MATVNHPGHIPRTVPEMAFYIDGVEKTINERLDTFDEKLTDIRESNTRLQHLVISSFIAPLIVGVIVAFIMKGVTFH